MPGMFRPTRPATQAARLHVEKLEDRCVPATFVVSSLANTGAGSLRAAVTSANTLAGQDTIIFSESLRGGTISLTTGKIRITDGVTISGLGGFGVTVSGAGTDNIFYVDTGLNQTTTITGLVLTNGAGFFGGSIYMGSCNLVLDSCVVTGNSSVTSGGAIRARTSGINTLTIKNTTISNNAASSGGGAVFFRGGSLIVQNSTISGNSAGFGGGGLYFNGSSLVVENSTVSGNASGRSGGGILITGSNSTGAIRNSTIAFNNASRDGGGLYIDTGYSYFSYFYYYYNNNAKAVTISSTIISNNSASRQGKDIDNNRGTLNVNYSLITTDVAGGGINGFNDQNIMGVDPGLAPLANNGGLTQTHAITGGSAAANRGINPSGLAFDQRGPGFSRTTGTATDIGAYEIPAAAAGGPTQLAYGLAVGVTASITNGAVSNVFVPFPGYNGPINVSTGLLTGNDQIPDRVYAVGLGAPAVMIVDGATNQLVASFFALPIGFTGGISVSMGDTTGDGRNDLIVATASQVSLVVVIDGTQFGKTLANGQINPLAYRFATIAFPGSTEGASIASADINGDGRADIITGSGRGQTGEVRVFSGFDGSILSDFLAFGFEFAGGISVTAGDVNGDGIIDIVVGMLTEGRMVAVQTTSGVVQFAFEAYPLDAVLNGQPLDFTGVNVGVADVNGDNALDIVTGVSLGSAPFVGAFRGSDGAAFFYTLAAPPGYLGGVSVNH